DGGYDRGQVGLPTPNRDVQHLFAESGGGPVVQVFGLIAAYGGDQFTEEPPLDFLSLSHEVELFESQHKPPTYLRVCRRFMLAGCSFHQERRPDRPWWRKPS